MTIFYNSAANECYIIVDYWPSWLNESESVWIVPGTVTE